MKEAPVHIGNNNDCFLVRKEFFDSATYGLSIKAYPGQKGPSMQYSNIYYQSSHLTEGIA